MKFMSLPFRVFSIFCGFNSVKEAWQSAVSLPVVTGKIG